MINKLKTTLKTVPVALGAAGAGVLAGGAVMAAFASTSASAAIASGAATGAAIGAATGWVAGHAIGGVGVLMSGGWLGFLTFGASKIAMPSILASAGSVLGASIGAGVVGVQQALFGTSATTIATDLVVTGGVMIAISIAAAIAVKVMMDRLETQGA